MPLPDWPRAHGLPLFAATLRRHVQDFDVTEELGFEPSGDGEHDFLFVEKTGINTEWLARQLAKFAAVPAKDVGYSGLKDRHAVTRQWFSVPRWNKPDWADFRLDGVRILAQTQNNRKLRRGAHQSNRFRIVLRRPPKGSEPFGAKGMQKGSEPFWDECMRVGSDVFAQKASAAFGEKLRQKGSDPFWEGLIQKGSDPFGEVRLRKIREEGVPNYFGEQRFGHGGGNVALADQWAAGRRLPRHKRSIALSSARSYLFNEMLASRVADNSWNTLLPGDVANLDGSGSVFAVDVLDEALHTRCKMLDIHPTALLWGDGGAADAAPSGHDAWLSALAKARVQPARRSLRLKVLDLQWQPGEDSLTLNFGLTRGAFATSVIRELATITDFASHNESEESQHEPP